MRRLGSSSGPVRPPPAIAIAMMARVPSRGRPYRYRGRRILPQLDGTTPMKCREMNHRKTLFQVLVAATVANLTLVLADGGPSTTHQPPRSLQRALRDLFRALCKPDQLGRSAPSPRDAQDGTFRPRVQVAGPRPTRHVRGEGRPVPETGHADGSAFQLWPAPRSASADRNSALADWRMT